MKRTECAYIKWVPVKIQQTSLQATMSWKVIIIQWNSKSNSYSSLCQSQWTGYFQLLNLWKKRNNKHGQKSIKWKLGIRETCYEYSEISLLFYRSSRANFRVGIWTPKSYHVLTSISKDLHCIGKKCEHLLSIQLLKQHKMMAASN